MHIFKKANTPFNDLDPSVNYNLIINKQIKHALTHKSDKTTNLFILLEDKRKSAQDL